MQVSKIDLIYGSGAYLEKVIAQLGESMPQQLTAEWVEEAIGQKGPNARRTRTVLRQLGIIGENDNPSDLAYQLRAGGEYAVQAARSILESHYAEELARLKQDPDFGRSKLHSDWKMRSGLGRSAVNQAIIVLKWLLQIAGYEKALDQIEGKPHVAEDMVEKRTEAMVTPDVEKRRPPARVLRMAEPMSPTAALGIHYPVSLVVNLNINLDSPWQPHQLDEAIERVKAVLADLGSGSQTTNSQEGGE